MQNGWFKDSDKWYLLLPNGAMATSTAIDGCQLGIDNVRILDENQAEPSSNIGLPNGYLVQNIQEGSSTKGYNIVTSGRTTDGDCWKNVTYLKRRGSYTRYSTDGEYKSLSGAISPFSQFDNGLLGKVTVYGGSDVVLYTSPDTHYNEEIMYLGADVSGQNQVRVEASLVTDDEWDDPIILTDELSLYK